MKQHSLSRSGYDRNRRCIKISIDGNTKDFHNLIEKLKNGDQSAFDEIYARCCGHVAFVCSKFCNNKEDAEEVVQDTFVIAFKKAGDLRGDTLLAYLRKIATNECFHKHKKNNRHQEYIVHSDELVEAHAEIDADFLPEEYLQEKESRIELSHVIEQLPRKQREIIYLYYYVEMSMEEIAQLQECSMDSAYKTLQRARLALKSKLESTGKKKLAKSMVLVPLTAVFFMEEQVFAKAYIPTATASSVAIAATAAKSTKVYVIVASVLTAGIITAAALYFTPSQSHDDYDIYEPVYEINAPALEAVADEVEEDIMEGIEPPEPPVEEEPAQVEEPEVIAKPGYVEEPSPEVIIEPELLEEPDPEPIPEPEAEEEPEPEVLPELEPEPIYIDRTAGILAALAVATTNEELNSIIAYYGFIFSSQTRSSTDELFRFYVTDEGSGDILVGTGINEDGTGWRMRFELYSNGQRPLDIFELFLWMEE